MRKLTVIRRKTFVASLMKVYIYLESKDRSDLVLDRIQVIKIGELKKEEAASYEIPSDDVYFFVVFDKLFPNKYHTKHLIKASDKDVLIYIKARFSPFKGNPVVITEDK